MLRYTLFALSLVFACTLISSCTDKAIEQPAASEELVSPHANPTPTSISLRLLTDDELSLLEKESGLTVLQPPDEKTTRAYRWSDDREGAKYGKVACEGRCGVVDAGNDRIGIGCVDENDEIISSGAYRDRP